MNGYAILYVEHEDGPHFNKQWAEFFTDKTLAESRRNEIMEDQEITEMGLDATLEVVEAELNVL